MKYNSFKELLKGTHNGAQHQNNAHPKTSPIDYDRLQLTNAQCYVVPISMVCYRESWTIKLKLIFETRQERITVSHHPTHCHGHTNSWYVYFSQNERISIIKNAAMTYVMYIIIHWVHGPEPMSSGWNKSTTYRFRHLFLDLLVMGWKGCVMGVIALPSSCSSPKTTI